MGALYREYRPRIYRYITCPVGDTAVADDLTAEVFVLKVKNIRQNESTPCHARGVFLLSNRVRPAGL